MGRMRTHRLIVGLIIAASQMTPQLAPAAPRAIVAKGANRPSTADPVLPWIDDDLTRAMAEAKARKLPIFVESWAPW